jgi:hypothetical protein
LLTWFASASGIFAAADTDRYHTIGPQHVLDFRNERDRMRLAPS